MRRLLKFLHLLAACGVVGALATLGVLAGIVARLGEPQAGPLQGALDLASRVVFWPSVALLVLSGMLLVATCPATIEARWVWVKFLLLLALVPAAWMGSAGLALVLAVAALAMATWKPRLGQQRGAIDAE